MAEAMELHRLDIPQGTPKLKLLSMVQECRERSIHLFINVQGQTFTAKELSIYLGVMRGGTVEKITLTHASRDVRDSVDRLYEDRDENTPRRITVELDQGEMETSDEIPVFTDPDPGQPS